MIQTEIFGNIPTTGEEVRCITLSNATGMRVSILNWGCTVMECHVPDAKGECADVVCGFDRLEPYLGEHPYFGAVVGRVAGRITAGKFTLEGKSYALSCNHLSNHLHGGDVGLSHRLWSIDKLIDGEEPAVELSYLSPAGEEGYPANLQLKLRYRLVGQSLSMEVEATSDGTTPLSLTNHSYFNLSGHGSGSIENHHLQLKSDATIPCDENMTLLPERQPVEGKAQDFRDSKPMGEAIPHLFKQHGGLYELQENPCLEPQWFAKVFDPHSGREMNCYSTDTHCQLYTSMAMDGSIVGKAGKHYQKYAALCLEFQGYPDGVNHPELGDILLRKGETYRRTTIYAFSSKP